MKKSVFSHVTPYGHHMVDAFSHSQYIKHKAQESPDKFCSLLLFGVSQSLVTLISTTFLSISTAEYSLETIKDRKPNSLSYKAFDLSPHPNKTILKPEMMTRTSH